jgi:hypothetical protein
VVANENGIDRAKEVVNTEVTTTPASNGPQSGSQTEQQAPVKDVFPQRIPSAPSMSATPAGTSTDNIEKQPGSFGLETRKPTPAEKEAAELARLERSMARAMARNTSKRALAEVGAPAQQQRRKSTSAESNSAPTSPNSSSGNEQPTTNESPIRSTHLSGIKLPSEKWI